MAIWQERNEDVEKYKDRPFGQEHDGKLEEQFCTLLAGTQISVAINENSMEFPQKN